MVVRLNDGSVMLERFDNFKIQDQFWTYCGRVVMCTSVR